MILGMSTATFTTLHVVLSLIGIVSGAIVLIGLLTAKRLRGLTALFLASTVLTSASGFFFQSASSSPARVVAIISLLLLAVALLALYAYHLAGAWRWIYVATAVVLLSNALSGCAVVPASSAALAPTRQSPRSARKLLCWRSSLSSVGWR